MRVLITNTQMYSRSGTTIFVRDLAIELTRQGHQAAVYTLVRGDIVHELTDNGIRVETRLKNIPFKPDIIHGHHTPMTLSTLHYFTDVPAIYICHNHRLALEAAPIHPRISAYFGVSSVCVDRIRACGVEQSKTFGLHNSVDTKRFMPRTHPLPPHPRKALLFSNYATETTHLPAVRQACKETGIELDVVGSGVGKPVTAPETILGKYDLVFAKGKAAIEAMAVGAAVVLCDFDGVGPMVSNRDFNSLQQHNFGFQTLQNPLDPSVIIKEIKKYDPADAVKVSQLARNQHDLSGMTAYLLKFYRQALKTSAQEIQNPLAPTWPETMRNALVMNLMRLHYSTTGNTCRGILRKIPGINKARNTYWRMVQGILSNLPT